MILRMNTLICTIVKYIIPAKRTCICLDLELNAVKVLFFKYVLISLK